MKPPTTLVTVTCVTCLAEFTAETLRLAMVMSDLHTCPGPPLPGTADAELLKLRDRITRLGRGAGKDALHNPAPDHLQEATEMVPDATDAPTETQP